MDFDKLLDAIYNFVSEKGLTSTSLVAILIVVIGVLLIFLLKIWFKSQKKDVASESSKDSQATLSVGDGSTVIYGNNNVVNDSSVMEQIVTERLTENNKNYCKSTVVDKCDNPVPGDNHKIIYKRK